MGTFSSFLLSFLPPSLPSFAKVSSQDSLAPGQVGYLLPQCSVNCVQSLGRGWPSCSDHRTLKGPAALPAVPRRPRLCTALTVPPQMHVSVPSLASSIFFSLPILSSPLPSLVFFLSFCICLRASLCLYVCCSPCFSFIHSRFSLSCKKISKLLFKAFSFLNLDEKAGDLIQYLFLQRYSCGNF